MQSPLRHSKIQTSLDLYTQEDSDETLAAQRSFLTAMGSLAFQRSTQSKSGRFGLN